MMKQQTMILKDANGTFSLLPSVARSLEKLYRILDEEMQSVGAQKITMPCLASKQVWDKTGWLIFLCFQCPIIGTNSFQVAGKTWELSCLL
jgi:hypothetical protein